MFMPYHMAKICENALLHAFLYCCSVPLCVKSIALGGYLEGPSGRPRYNVMRENTYEQITNLVGADTQRDINFR